jgi:hypothetical protein
MMMPDEKPSRGFKPKTIKSICRRKTDDWLASIEDEALRKRLAERVIITGGAIASMLLGEKVNDFDIYLRDLDATRDLAEYYVRRFKTQKKAGIDVPLSVQVTEGRVRIVAKSAGVASEAGTEKPYQYFESRPEGEGGEYVQDVLTDPAQIEDAYQDAHEKARSTTSDKDEKKYRPIFLTSNAITLADQIQVVLRFYGEPDEIHENYDFVHCTSYWTSWNNELVLRPAALEALLSRTLTYIGGKYPICSLVRVRKFITRGWVINAGQLLKMAFQISQLDLTDLKVLEDQLTGVDTAYFLELVEKLKERDPEKVNAAYLVELVDKIF